MPHTALPQIRTSRHPAPRHATPRCLVPAVLLTVLVLALLGASTLGAQESRQALPHKGSIVLPGTVYTTYTGLWRPTNGEVEARTASSLMGFEAHRTELTGWRLVDLEHRFGLWAGLWRPTSDLGEVDRIVVDIEPADLASTVIDQRADGFELVDLEIERRSGVVRVDGLFHPGVEQHEVHLNLDLANFPALQSQLALDGKVLVDIETYLNAFGIRRWAGVWKQLPPAAPMPDRVVALASPGTADADFMVDDQGRYPIDFEAYSDQSGFLIAGIWETNGSHDDWFRGIVDWSSITDRAESLIPDPGGLVVSPIKTLVDVDIITSFSGLPVRPMPVDHDGPVGPVGP